MAFLFLHGLGGSGTDHWQSWLAEKLHARGDAVLFPQLPNANQPRRATWLAALDGVLRDNTDAEPLTVLTHSLGGVLWLHYAALHPEVKTKRVFLVAPPPDDCGMTQIADFFPLPPPPLPLNVANYLVVASDNDQYISFGKFKAFSSSYGIPLHLISGSGHINTSAGFGPWPWILQQMQ